MHKIMKYNNLLKHPYHLVDPSPWPLIISISLFFLTFGNIMVFHNIKNGLFLVLIGFILILTIMFTWWRDIIREATFEGQHTIQVQKGLKIGMLLFILSEVMFFISFFWAFFHSSLSPTVELGGIWPPKELHLFSAWEIPLLNTLILLTSGATLTWSHHSIISGNIKKSWISLSLTLALAIIFTVLQIFEYNTALFSISDSVYGSLFFLLTGFHGLHVVVGTIFLSICYIRLINSHFTKQHHFGFEAAAWYWHFVDVVWLFLFILVYWWGGQ